MLVFSELVHSGNTPEEISLLAEPIELIHMQLVSKSRFPHRLFPYNLQLNNSKLK